VSELPYQSAWAQLVRIDVRGTEGEEEGCFFFKVSTISQRKRDHSVGVLQATNSVECQASFKKHGREAIKGELVATRDIHAIAPEFCAEPTVRGTFASHDEAHFELSKFYHFQDDKDLLPNPDEFYRHLAILHKSSKPPAGKFGYGCASYNGDPRQDNTWYDSWEAASANGLRHVFPVREKRVGPHPPELDHLLPLLCHIVVPRLLGPLERDGRSVKPSLAHGDLWYGNVSRKECWIYDSASFYAHECTRSIMVPTVLRRQWMTCHGLQMSLGSDFRRETSWGSHPSRHAITRIGSCSIPCECTNAHMAVKGLSLLRDLSGCQQ
jgi:hypothetical protein